MGFRHWINTWRRRLIWRNYATVYFSGRGLLCTECHAIIPLEGLVPISFTVCKTCRLKNFVPLHIKDFLLFEPLGAGGIASVYKAYRQNNGKKIYALKILRQEDRTRQDYIQTLMTEAELHKQVPDHKNIVKYIDSGCEDGEYFYALEFLPGERVKTRLDTRGLIPEAETLKIIRHVLAAFDHIYQAGFLYRDVSAGNIIITPDGTAKLIDFGLAMSIEEAEAESDETAIWGTSEFIPPERIYRTGENASSVIYSTGMLLINMLTGKPFVSSSSNLKTVKRHISPARLAITSQLIPNCSQDLLDMINKMIKQNPEERPQTFEEVQQALAAIKPRRTK